MGNNYILWADDDLDDLQLFKDILKSSEKDIQIVEAENGIHVLRHLDMARKKDHLPSLIILDINMPVLDGKQTLTAIKSEGAYEHIPVVVFTTSDSILDKQFCQRHRVEMITKPPSFKRLQAVVARIIAYCK